MGLRCKAGQLVILGTNGNCQANLRRFIGQIHVTAEYINDNVTPNSWSFDPPVFDRFGRNVVWLDTSLIPINDQPGEDETLRYAGKPAPVVRKLTAPEFDAAVKSWEKA